MTHWVPELLAPAGSLEKLKTSVLYGADAVYLGGQKFGLRTAAENFTYQQLEEGVAFAHKHGSKVFVTLNSFMHDSDLDELPEFLQFIDQIGVDAVIVSDLGVVLTVLKNCNVPVHLSTQASCLNIESAKYWKSMGVTRLVLGREISLAEAAKIKKEANIEVELFIHGSMCMAYSGNCVISNYTQGRDSNRGGCAHSCRFEYSYKDNDQNENEKTAFFMSSKDLNGANLLKDYIECEIDSLKIEGRMKSQHYAATVTKAYRELLDEYSKEKAFTEGLAKYVSTELNKVTHRDYTQASLVEKASEDSIYDERLHEKSQYMLAGQVLEALPGNEAIVAVRAKFSKKSKLEILPLKNKTISFMVENILNLYGDPLAQTRPSTLVKIKTPFEFKPFEVIRMKVEN